MLWSCENTFCTQKPPKITTLFNNSSPLHQRSAILENIRWKQTAYAVLCQPHRIAISGFSPKWRYADAEETNLLNKVVIFLGGGACIQKSVLVASLNSDWTTDGRWTILTMSFILFWALTVLIVWQSMGQSQTSRFSSKISSIVFRRRIKLLRVWNDLGVSD